MSNQPQAEVEIVETTRAFDAKDAASLIERATAPDAPVVVTPAFEAARLPHWFKGEESWPAGSPGRLAMIEYLNDNFPLLEDKATGTRVGIGIATGADSVFITSDRSVAEADRLLPLAMVRDTATGKLEWGGKYLVNPWSESGDLVELANHPTLAGYFEEHRGQLGDRYVATKAPAKWYKTIDKVDARLTGRAKLLIPDMRMTINPVLDEGETYPHHNLYYVVSDTWDMRVLGGLLLSRVAQAFVEAYAVKMRGGTLRFQAQYLRRIRVPRQRDLSVDDARELADAFDARDVGAATRVALRVFKLEALVR